MAEVKNMRFGVKLMPHKTPLEEDVLSLYWRFEYGEETYGDYLLFRCGYDGRYEVPADVFLLSAKLLRQQMQSAADMLEKGAEDVYPQEQ